MLEKVLVMGIPVGIVIAVFGIVYLGDMIARYHGHAPVAWLIAAIFGERTEARVRVFKNGEYKTIIRHYHR